MRTINNDDDDDSDESTMMRRDRSTRDAEQIGLLCGLRATGGVMMRVAMQAVKQMSSGRLWACV